MRVMLPLCFAASFLRGQELPTPLEYYLDLTREQSRSIARNEADFELFQRQKADRAGRVRAEIAAENARRPLDPAGLGLRYVELETIRRELDEQTRTRALANQRLLTPAQRAKLGALDSARRLQELVSMGVCTGLIDIERYSEILPGFRRLVFPGFVIPASRFSPAGISRLSAAQPFCAFAEPLFDTLQFSAAQRRTVSNGSDSFRSFLSAKEDRFSQVEREIAELTAAASLEAHALGLRYVEIETILQEIRDESERARAGLRATLTPPQKQRLETLTEAGALQAAVSPAECIGLLDPPPQELGLGLGRVAFFFAELPLRETSCGAVRP